MNQAFFPIALIACLLLSACALHPHAPGEEHTIVEDEHVSHTGDASNSTLDAIVEPAVPQAGEEATLHVLSASPLLAHHERVLHIVAVGNDFDAFAHLHPEDFGTLESAQHFQVPLTFPEAGEYLLLLDGMDKDGALAARPRVTVTGDVPEISSENITCVRSTPLAQNDVLAGFVSLSDLKADCDDAYEIDLFRNPDGAIRFSARFQGAPLEPEQYLGAYAHLAIVSTDLSVAYHEHSDFGSGMFSVTPYLPPGNYVIFPQVKHNGTLVVTRFFIDVE